MGTRVIAALTVALVLSACALPSKDPIKPSDFPADLKEVGFDRATRTPPVQCVVDVFIDADEDIIATHEPVHTRRCTDVGGGPRVRVLWRLPQPGPGGPVYAFAPAGVVFNKLPLPAPMPDCKTGLTPQAYRCIFAGRTSQAYAYTIYVLKDGRPWKSLDPHMVND